MKEIYGYGRGYADIIKKQEYELTRQEKILSAKGMFEKLGYTYEYNEEYKIITYSYEDWAINFDIENKLIGFCNMGSYCELTNDDIQAINQQMKEIGVEE